MEDELDLKEVRALAAAVYPSLAAHGHPTKTAVENALEVAELLVERSEARAQARRDVEQRELEARRNGGDRSLVRSRA